MIQILFLSNQSLPYSCPQKSEAAAPPPRRSHGNHFSAFAAVNWTPGGQTGFDRGSVSQCGFHATYVIYDAQFSINVAGFGYGQWRWRLGQGEKLGMGSQKNVTVSDLGDFYAIYMLENAAEMISN